ncbi:uncharacterized protein LOC131055476 [Cryptomeria japonica]|uniref:uncharacterized protein LOC131055476 n=1 Tax=Cryptomeria japonica TaxID=3369 RepID=UPI0027DA8463|nr:uncharacterized protein LOC131055476 [Cryptomeria japonica]
MTCMKNPFFNENRKDNNPRYEEHLTKKEKKNKQWDAIILQMDDLGGDEAKMARAMKRQPDEILKRLGVKREHLYCTDTSSCEPTSSGTSRPSTPKYSPPNMRNFEKNTTNEEGPWSNNGRWRNVHSEYYQNDGGNNRGYNPNYGGNYNNGNGNGNGNGNNNWNNGNNNNGNNNNDNGYNGNNNYNGGGNNGNHDTVEQHVMNVKNTIEEFEIPHEDVFMKLFVQSLTQDVGEWYQSLPDRSISSWQEFVTLFLEEFGDHNDPSFASHELTSIKKNQNEFKTHNEILSHKAATLQQA